MRAPRLLAATLAALLMVAGCSNDPQPRFADPTETVSPTGSPSAEPSADHGLTVFFERYIGSITQAISTGDVSQFLAMSSRGCRNCVVLARNVERAYEEGGRIDGGRWTFESAAFQRKTETGELWYVDVSSTTERWLNAEGRVIKRYPAGARPLALEIRKRARDYAVVELRVRQ